MSYLLVLTYCFYYGYAFYKRMLFSYAYLNDSHLCVCFLPYMAMSLSLLQNSNFLTLLPIMRQRIIEGFNPTARDLFQREFNFFEKVTAISGILFSLPKEERRAGIRRYCLRFPFFLSSFKCGIFFFLFILLCVGSWKK